MKKNRIMGFTLIELIAVLVVLAIILAIAVPSITGVVKSAKEKACVLDAGMMEKAAKTLVQMEGFNIRQGDQKTISLETLKNSKYLSEVLDPADQKTPCDGYVIVTNTDGNYTYHAALKCSNTCQTADYNDDLGNTTTPNDLDTIEKNGDQYFEGANPNNWVKFGRMDENDKHGIMWRIIKIDNFGIKMVYEGIENGSLKPLEDGRALIDGSMGVPWDNTGKNKWNEPASLVGKLDNWLNHIYITNLQDYVSAATWKVGGVPYQAPTNLRTFLTYQDIDSTNTGGNFSGLTSYKSVIGMINAVDFMYTSDNEECAYSYKETGSDNECAYNVDGSLNNFLQKDRYHYWTLNARSDSTNRAWNITNSGLIGSSLTNLSAVSVRPVLNLKLGTEFLAGTGTIEDPYILEDYMVNIWNSPTITLNGDSTIYVRQYDSYIDEGATAVDEEDGDLTDKIVTTGTVDINTPGEYTIEYNVTDADGNKAIPVTRKVIIVERDKPIITLNGANPTYITIYGTYDELGATAYDINYGDISSSIVISGTVDTTTLGTYYITYNVTNQDGIKAPEVTRKVIVKVPTPKITLNGPNPTLVDIGTTYTEEGATATDEVDGDLTSSIQKTIERYNDTLRKWETVSSVSTSKITIFHIKYSVTNSFGVNAFVTRTVNIVKADGPTITYTPDGGTASKKVYETKINVTKTKYNVDSNTLKYFTYNSYTRFSSTNFESYFRTPFKDGDTVKLSSGTGYYYVYAIAKDIYGNTRMKNSKSFRIDNSAPVITMRSGISRILLHKTYKDPGATATDKYFDGNLTSKIITTGTVDTEHEGIYYVTYEVTDSAGNKTTAKRRIEVYHPTPQIYLNGGSSLRLLYGTPYVEQGARAIDEVDGDITGKIIITGSVDIHKEGTYTITYSATNSSGHTGTRTRTVEVYIPNPEITILGSNPAKVMIHSSYSDAGATVNDTLDGNLTSRLITTGTVNVDVKGTYYITYSVTNNLGKNTAVKRSVVVYVPTPKITILGNNPYPLFKGQSYTDQGATAMDDLDGDLTSEIIATGTVNTTKDGTYPITYTVTNSEGGIGASTRNVVVRKSAINIALSGSRSMELLRGTPYVEPGYTATDELDGDVTSKVVVSSNVNPNVAGTYQVTYTVTNSGGDTKTVTRTVTYRKPDLKIILVGDASVTLLRGTPYVEPGYTAIDEIDGDITNKVIVTSNIVPTIAGTYKVTYTITNSGGDTASITRSVIIRKPLLTITLIGPGTVDMLRGGTYVEQGYTATDEIDGDITSKVTLLSDLSPFTNGKYTIQYRVVNSGGDEKTVIRNITVRDPKVTIALNGEATVELPIGSVYSDAGATATDELLGDVSSKIVATPDLNPNVLGTYYVNYEVTSSGVKATAKRTVKVAPLPGPMITFTPNGESTYKKEQQTIVTITKGDRDVDISSFKYLWKTDLSKPTESSFSTSFSGGDTIKTPAGVTGKYYLFVLAKDVYGNVSILGSNGFNVDNTVPVITLNGNKVIETPVDGIYTEPGATVLEIDSGIDDNGLVITSNLVPGIIGTYQVTYNATDKAGNKATTVVRTISVIEATLKDAPSEDFIPLYDASYFIGSNAANWVEFGNAADNVYDYIPIMWRIIKADDNGIKIIYEGVKDGDHTTQNGTIGKFQWDDTNNTWNRPSTIRTVLNNFYTNLNEENKDTMTKKISWCVGKIKSPYTLDNFKNDECSVMGSDLSSIGLASAGDYILTSKDPCSGYNQASCGTNNFLKKNYSYFTISADASGNVGTFIINSNGGLTRDEATKSLDVRPVINLRPDVLILSGEGTFDNPYKLNARIPVIDNDAPVIAFSPASATGQLEDRKVEVVVTDELTGVNNESLKYVWTTSTSQPSVDTITNSFENGSKIAVPTDLTGNYYLWVIAKDRKGNQAISKGGPYLVDNEPPVITMNGSSPIKVAVGSVYNDAGSTAIDNIDGNITSKIKVTSNVIPNIVGTYQVTYNVSDTAGNAATPATRTVIVYETTPPVVTFNPNGNSGYTLASGSTTVTVTDNEAVEASSLKYVWTTSTSQPSEGSFANAFTNGSTLNVPTSPSGTYYLWVIAKDNNANTTIVSSNAFHIDNQPPVITLNGSAAVNVNINGTYNDAGATAMDDIDGNITNNIVTTSDVNTAVMGTYTVTYNVTDSSGNAATQVTRTIYVAPLDVIANFSYTGGVQSFIVPYTGVYKLEVWGAQGGQISSAYYGGYGGYSVGTYTLTANTTVYIYVGGAGSMVSGAGCLSGGWNGGGGTCSPATSAVATGGGATDISLSDQTVSLNIYGARVKQSYTGIIIVAGGGGGSTSRARGGAGGGYLGASGTNAGTYGYGTGGSQTAGGGGYNVGTNNNTCYYVTARSCNGNVVGATQTCTFTGSLASYGNTGSCSWAGGHGYGAGYKMTSTMGYGMGNHHGAAGGGGYYGGGLGGTAQYGGGGGGSGYIGGVSTSSTYSVTRAMYCYNCNSSSTGSTYTVSTSNVSSTATSNYAKSGNGYARITYLGQ